MDDLSIVSSKNRNLPLEKRECRKLLSSYTFVKCFTDFSDAPKDPIKNYESVLSLIGVKIAGKNIVALWHAFLIDHIWEQFTPY